MTLIHLCLFDLRAMSKKGGISLFAMLFFLLSFSFAFFFLKRDINGFSAEMQLVVYGLSWLSLLFACQVTAQALMQQSDMIARFSYCYVSGVSVEILLLSKYITGWLLTGVPLGILLLLIDILFLGHELTGQTLLCVLMGTVLLVVLTHFGSLFSLSSRLPGMVGVLVTFPFAIPAFIFIIHAMQPMLSAEDNAVSAEAFSLLLMIFLFTVPLFLLASRAVLVQLIRK